MNNVIVPGLWKEIPNIAGSHSCSAFALHSLLTVRTYHTSANGHVSLSPYLDDTDMNTEYCAAVSSLTRHYTETVARWPHQLPNTSTVDGTSVHVEESPAHHLLNGLRIQIFENSCPLRTMSTSLTVYRDRSETEGEECERWAGEKWDVFTWQGRNKCRLSTTLAEV